MPAGKYTLRLYVQWEGQNPPAPTLHVRMREGVPQLGHVTLVLVLLTIFPILALFRAIVFEARRWADSMYTATGTRKSGDAGGDD